MPGLKIHLGLLSSHWLSSWAFVILCFPPTIHIITDVSLLFQLDGTSLFPSGLEEMAQAFQKKGVEDVGVSSPRSLPFLAGDQFVKDCKMCLLWSLKATPYPSPSLL